MLRNGIASWDSDVPHRATSLEPFRICRVGPDTHRTLARAYAALGSSRKLLRNLPVSFFLGEHQQGPFPDGDGPWSSATVTHIASYPDACDGDVKSSSAGVHVEPPHCPSCGGRMKWYRSRLAETSVAMIEHLFSCSTCCQLDVVCTQQLIERASPDDGQSSGRDADLRDSAVRFR